LCFYVYIDIDLCGLMRR